MTTARIVYKGALHTETTHVRSGQMIETDAPVDNNGKGAAFSPTDLCATSLGNCMITTLGIYAEAHGVDLPGMEASVTKYMASDPRRISRIEVDMTIFLSTTRMEDEKLKQILRKVAETCPVARSLHPDIEQVLNLQFAAQN
jgi:uncharacterized OsmC-like protein